MLGALVVGPPDQDLGVGRHSGQGLAAVGLLVGHFAEGPLGRVQLHEAPAAQGQVEVRELLLFVAGGEADLLEDRPAVRVPRATYSP